MSPIECIKQGILEENWKIVCEGYEKLTGEVIECRTDIFSNKACEILDKITKILGTYSEIPEDIKASDTTNKVSKKKTISKQRKKSVKKTNNKKSTVTEDGEDSSLQLNESDRTDKQIGTGGIHLITNEIDPEEVETNKKKAAKSKRYKLELNRVCDSTYKVKCNECQHEFDSKRPAGEMGQKCGKCLNGLRSRFA